MEHAPGFREHFRQSPRFRRRVYLGAGLFAVIIGLALLLVLVPEHPPRHSDRGGGTGSLGFYIGLGVILGGFATSFALVCRGLFREMRSPSWTHSGQGSGLATDHLESVRGTQWKWTEALRRR